MTQHPMTQCLKTRAPLMRSTTHGGSACGWVAALLLALLGVLGHGPPVCGQEGAFAGWDEISAVDYEYDRDRVAVTTFAIQSSSEVQFRFYRAEQAMKDGEWRLALEPLQEIINMFPNHLYPVADHRWVGAAEYARYLLSTFPPEGLDAYAEWASLRTEVRLREAIASPDGAILEELGARWPLTPEGGRALRLRGDRLLEAGDPDLASRFYRRRLGFEAPPAEDAAVIAFRAAAALVFSSRPDDARALLAPWTDERVHFGGRELSIGEGLQQLLLLALERGSQWSDFGGGGHRRGVLPNRPVDLSLKESWTQSAPVFSFTVDRNPYFVGGMERDRPFHAVASGGAFFTTDGLSIRSFSFLSPEPRWVHTGPLVDPAPGIQPFDDYRAQRGHPMVLARSQPHAPVVGRGTVIATLIDARPEFDPNRYDRQDINPQIPKRSLTAVDEITGEVLWTQRRPEKGEIAFENRLSVTNAPIIVGDRVIAAGHILEGAISVYVVCFSLATGDLMWRTPILVGQQELTMFNKAFKEFSLQMPAEHDGSVYVCSNLGMIAAVDLLSGDVRWATEYDAIPIESSSHYRYNNERDAPWQNDPPVVSDGVVVVTPLDSIWCYGIDAATGKIRWRQQAQNRSHRYRSLLGVDDGVVVLAGPYELGLHDLYTGAVLNSFDFNDGDGKENAISGRPAGRGVLAPGMIMLPMDPRSSDDEGPGLLEVTWRRTEIGGVRFESKRLIPWSVRDGANLLLYGEFAVAVGPQDVIVFADVESLIRKVQARVDAGAPSAVDLVELADLESQRRRYPAAILLYERALAYEGIDPAVARRCRDGLFRGHRELARLAHGDPEAEAAELELVAKYAPGDHEFLETIEALLSLFRGKDAERFLALLDQIDARCPDTEYAFRDHAYGGYVSAGLFSLVQRARTLEAMGRIEDAVAAWQRVILQYRDRDYEGLRAGEYARSRIDEVIARFGPEVFEAFEAQIESQHRVAVQTGDPVAMKNLIESYPNSTGATSRRLDLARLLLDRGEHADLFEALAPLLSDEELPERSRAEAMWLAAAAAEASASEPLARALLERIRADFDDLPAAGGEGDTYGRVAAAKLASLGVAVDVNTGAAELESLPAMTPRSMPLTFSSFHHLVEVDGSALPGDRDAVILHEAAAAVGDNRSRLRCIDVTDMTEMWSSDSDPYYDSELSVRGYRFGPNLVIWQRFSLRGYDAMTGEERYVRRLPYAPVAVERGDGLLFAAWDRGHKDWVVAAFAPSTGTVFWQRSLRPREVRDIKVSAGRVLVLGTDGMVEALDELTGAPRYKISLIELSGSIRMKAFESVSLLLVSGNGVGARGGYRQLLMGFDLNDGRPLFALRDLLGSLDPGELELRENELLLPVTGGAGGDVQQIIAIRARTGERRVLVDGLVPFHVQRANAGAFMSGDFGFLAAGGRSRRRGESDHITVLDLASGTRRHHLEVEMNSKRVSPIYSTVYQVYRTSDTGFAGTIVARAGDSSHAYVFRLDPSTGDLEVQRIPAEGRYTTKSLVTRHALVVLQTDGLHAYPAGGKR